MSASVALLCHVMLVCVFAWAALAKLVRPARWRSALTRYRLGVPIERIAAYGVPATEGGVVVLLMWGDTRAGAALAVALVSAFSLAVLRARALSGDRVPCGCFGAASTRDYRELLARNALIAAGAAGLLLAGPRDHSWSVPAGADLLPAMLAGGGVVLVAWVVRQASISLRRRA